MLGPFIFNLQKAHDNDWSDSLGAIMIPKTNDKHCMNSYKLSNKAMPFKNEKTRHK
jgi:hypothetical protein